jgi:HPt (histidine-containing phosphotransfer) domain-containing protein
VNGVGVGLWTVTGNNNFKWRGKMTVQECYEKMNGDYEEVKERLMKDERIEKYLRKFLDATDYRELMEALEKEDFETAFRASHTLKGLSLNLGFTELKNSSEALCEALRGGKPKVDIQSMVQAVTNDYERVTAAVRLL